MRKMNCRKMKERMHCFAAWMRAFIRRRYSSIIYYGAIVLVLSAIALAADDYRADDLSRKEALILPAVEMQVELESKPRILHAPQGSDIIRAYSIQPEWNVHLGQWQSHPATDYLMEDDIIYSLSAGRIVTIGKSGVYGGFIEIESGEYLLRYASITPMEELEVGGEVALGTPIATADTNMPGEHDMQPHLHLELMRDGQMIDFASEADKIEFGH